MATSVQIESIQLELPANNIEFTQDIGDFIWVYESTYVPVTKGTLVLPFRCKDTSKLHRLCVAFEVAVLNHDNYFIGFTDIIGKTENDMHINFVNKNIQTTSKLNDIFIKDDLLRLVDNPELRSQIIEELNKQQDIDLEEHNVVFRKKKE